jgi:hypothetical protein
LHAHSSDHGWALLWCDDGNETPWWAQTAAMAPLIVGSALVGSMFGLGIVTVVVVLGVAGAWFAVDGQRTAAGSLARLFGGWQNEPEMIAVPDGVHTAVGPALVRLCEGWAEASDRLADFGLDGDVLSDRIGSVIWRLARAAATLRAIRVEPEDEPVIDGLAAIVASTVWQAATILLMVETPDEFAAAADDLDGMCGRAILAWQDARRVGVLR